jgi:hypothetical protein
MEILSAPKAIEIGPSWSNNTEGDMKMVKKCMIAVAVAALMVTTVRAGDPAIKRDGDWPWTYKAIDLCTIPVYMDVGHYVQL